MVDSAPRFAFSQADLVAGLTTAAVVLPKALAYASIAGLPLQVGLYTALIPAVVYAFLGTSRNLSVSTTTTIAILGATALGEVAKANPGVSLAVATATLGVLVGAILLLASVLKMGFVANFISDPVLTGFKAGIGVVIVVDQVPRLLGIHIHKEGFFRDLYAMAAAVPETSIPTFALAIATFVLIGLMERFTPKAPTPLVAVGVGIAASAWMGLPALGVGIVGKVPGGMPGLTLPDTSLLLAMWPAAVGIALMSFTETIAAGRAFAPPGTPRPDSNRELLAIGAGNVAGAFFSGMPSGGGTSQTAVNANAGAKSQVTGLVVAATAVATMLFLAPVLGAMPHATLAAVVIAYSIGLISPSELKAIRQVRTMEFRWALAAVCGVVLLGTLNGILVAVILSMAGLMHLANNPPMHVLVRKPGTNVFRPRTDEHPEDEAIPGLLIARTQGRVYFGNAQTIGGKLQALIASEKPRVVVLDCGAIPGFEYTALKMLIEGEAKQRALGVELWFAALNPEALEVFRRTSLGETLGRERLFFTVEAAVEAYKSRFPTQAAGK